MIKIGEITSVPYTKCYNKKKYTYYTYLIEFLNEDDTPVEISTPKMELSSDIDITNMETKIKGNNISYNVKLNIRNKKDRELYCLKIKSIEREIYHLIRKDYTYIQIFNNRIENIQTKYHMKDNIRECINKKDVLVGTLSIMGCITLQNTFEIIYTLEKIECCDIIDEIFNILLNDENLLNKVEEELEIKLNDEKITICDIKSVNDVEFLQSEINKLINE